MSISATRFRRNMPTRWTGRAAEPVPTAHRNRNPSSPNRWERYLGRLNQQLADLELAAAEHEAVNSEPGMPAEIPADLQQDIEDTKASIADYEARLATNRTEQERIREKFAVDIARFRELKGLPPEGTTASQ